MTCTTFIDESGNTGDDLASKNQRYFTLSAVMIPDTAIPYISRNFEMTFNKVKEKEETEIKATKWVKSPKKCEAMQAILDCLVYYKSEFALVFIEKRFMISAIIVDDFLDGAYNDTEDYTWVNNAYEKKLAAQYFYDLLSDDDVSTIFESFRHPDFDAFRQAYEIVVNNTNDLRYQRMLKGCSNHLRKLYEDNISAAASFPSVGIMCSPNFTAFSALGSMVAKVCRTKGMSTKILFDHCCLVDQSYEDLYKIFIKAEFSPEQEAFLKLISWKGLVTDFNISNSKSINLLQTADIVASSSLKTLQKIFERQSLSQYDFYVMSLISVMQSHDNFLYVMSKEKIDMMEGFLIYNS